MNVTPMPAGLAQVMERVKLVAALAHRDILSRYAGSYLGLVWAFAVPLLSSAVYILVFGTLMQAALLGDTYRGFDFTTFYLLGFAPWLLFNEVVGRAPQLLRENRNLIRNTRFEHRLLPLVAYASSSVAHVIILLLCAVLIAVKGYDLSSRLYWLPVFFLFLALFTMGVAYIVAALSPYLQDLGQIVPIFLSLYFFACPVIYTPQLVAQAGPMAKLFLLDLNPMARIIEGYRLSAIEVDVPLTALGMTSLGLLSLLTFALGLAVYRHLEGGFADVL